jgi:phosphoserine phosphatase
MSRMLQGRPAAFFDLDGTLAPPPSLEWRFVRLLRYRRLIVASQGLAWATEALRLAPRGLSALRNANKMHLRGISSDLSAISPHFRIAFFPGGIERVAKHAAEGHALVLVSGTLQPLAQIAALTLERELAARGHKAAVEVCATQLEESAGRWTGRLVGEPMNGPAKARAARQIAATLACDPGRSYAYGNSRDDIWILSAVGHPAAVHPSRWLKRVAREAGWPILDWSEQNRPTLRPDAATQHSKETHLCLIEKWRPNP